MLSTGTSVKTTAKSDRKLIGYLHGDAVAVVYTEVDDDTIRIISFRKAARVEREYLDEQYYSDLEHFHAMSDEDIDLSDDAEATEEWLSNARVVRPEPQWIRQFALTAPKEVVDWFRTAPEGRDEAVLAALQEYIERHPREA